MYFTSSAWVGVWKVWSVLNAPAPRCYWKTRFARLRGAADEDVVGEIVEALAFTK